jgi:two-component system CheB/CheR fusion protein
MAGIKGETEMKSSPEHAKRNKGSTADISKVDEGDAENFLSLLDYLLNNRGCDFTGYKRQSLLRRVRRRMQAAKIASFKDYRDFLETNRDEVSRLFDTILINVTSFCRDKDGWTHLSEEIIPRVASSKKEGESIRIWSAGCASGEEAYTIAMLMIEAIGAAGFKDRVKIIATDIDNAALAQARRAVYTAKDVEAVPSNIKDKYFLSKEDAYIFRPDLRKFVIFGRHDLIRDTPISNIDLLICRNTLMYFNAETQSKILAGFHFSLKDAGYLFLGRAELLLTHTDLFAPVSMKHRIFKKAVNANRSAK